MCGDARIISDASAEADTVFCVNHLTSGEYRCDENLMDVGIVPQGIQPAATVHKKGMVKNLG